MRFAIIGAELVVRVHHLGPDQLPVLELFHRQLDAVVAHGAQALIGHQAAGSAALTVDALRLSEAVVEGVFFCRPFETGETCGHLLVPIFLVHRLDGIGDLGGDKAISLGLARGLHELFG